jgi:carotenoid cleavage dioxygenase-like enzyme
MTPEATFVPRSTLQADTEARTFVAKWEADDGGVCGEPLFVPAPGFIPGSAEDAGVVVVFVTGAAHSYVAVLDAAGLGELARLQLPGHAPLAFHGNFYPDRC